MFELFLIRGVGRVPAAEIDADTVFSVYLRVSVSPCLSVGAPLGTRKSFMKKERS